MSFWNSFTHGFTHGVIDRMLWGGGCWSACCWQTPMFFTPPLFTCGPNRYMTPSVNVPQLPLFTFQQPSQMNWTDNNFNFNYKLPDFSANPKIIDWGTFNCSFTVTTKKKTEEKSEEKPEVEIKHWSEMSDSELKKVYGNYTRDITKAYGGTAEDLNKYLKGKGKLEGMGQAFIDAQNEHGISAAVLVAIAMNESAGGTSNLAKNKNNIGGVRISGSTEFRAFDSVEACINEIARFLKAGYVNNSGRALTALYQVNAKYCPATDTTDKEGTNNLWARNVERYAKEVEEAKV